MRRALLLLLLVTIALAVQAPAWLLASSVQERSGGLVALHHTAGTIWKGEADVVIPGRATAQREIFAGRIAWRVLRIDPWQRALVIEIQQTPAAARPATIKLGVDHMRFSGSMRLPAAVAARAPLLSAWTMRGDVVLESEAMDWAGGAASGAATVLWRGAAVVPPDLPGGFTLGDTTASISVDGAGVMVSLRNTGGELALTGDASSRAGTVAILLQPRGAAPGLSGAQLAWLQSHTMGRTANGYTITTGWPGR